MSFCQTYVKAGSSFCKRQVPRNLPLSFGKAFTTPTRRQIYITRYIVYSIQFCSRKCVIRVGNMLDLYTWCILTVCVHSIASSAYICTCHNKLTKSFIYFCGTLYCYEHRYRYKSNILYCFDRSLLNMDTDSFPCFSVQ